MQKTKYLTKFIVSMSLCTGAAYCFSQQIAGFSGKTDSFRWLAQSVSMGGNNLKDCQKNTINLPRASYEDAGARLYKHPDDATIKTYYPPSLIKAMKDPKQQPLPVSNEQFIALKHQFPKLTGPVHGFDAQGNRTISMMLNADILSILKHGQDVCYAFTSTPDQTPQGLKKHAKFAAPYVHSVQALYANDAVERPKDAVAAAALSKTVAFSSDPSDVPFIAQAQLAPEEVAAKLNAQLKAKLTRELVALHNQKDQNYIAILPRSVNAFFKPCPVYEYALNVEASRKVYELRCLKNKQFGFYEMTENGTLLAVKIADTSTSQQRKDYENMGIYPHPFTKGIAAFDVMAWVTPHMEKRPNGSVETLTMLTNNANFAVQIKGLFDLIPWHEAKLAQIYIEEILTSSGSFELVGYVPGAKPGDAWTKRKQNWPRSHSEG